MEPSGTEGAKGSGNEPQRPSRGSASFDLVPYVATRDPPPAPPPQPKSRRFASIFWRGTALAACFGLGWMAASMSHPRKAHDASIASSGSSPAAPAATPDTPIRPVLESLSAARASIDGLAAAVGRTGAAPALAPRLDTLVSSVEGARSETRTAIADLANRIDTLQRETAEKLRDLTGRLDHLEQLPRAETVSAALSGKPDAARDARNPPGKAPPETTAVTAPKKPPLIRNWVVRDVYDGLALVESAEGAVEVAPGELLPGAGRVRSIERRGRGWIVVTSRGVIGHAPGLFQR